MKLLLYTLCISNFLLLGTMHTQTVLGKYLNPKNIDNKRGYKYVKFGEPGNDVGGFMYNISNAAYGDGDDFALYTYGNNDFNFEAHNNDINLFPYGSQAKFSFKSSGDFNMAGYVVSDALITNKIYHSLINPRDVSAINFGLSTSLDYGFIGLNHSDINFGDGDDLVISSIDNKDLTFASGTAAIHLFNSNGNPAFSFSTNGDLSANGTVQMNVLNSLSAGEIVIDDNFNFNNNKLIVEESITANTIEVETEAESFEAGFDDLYTQFSSPRSIQLGEDKIIDWPDLHSLAHWDHIIDGNIEMNGYAFTNIGKVNSGAGRINSEQAKTIIVDGNLNFQLGGSNLHELDIPRFLYGDNSSISHSKVENGITLGDELIENWSDLNGIEWDYEIQETVLLRNQLIKHEAESSGGLAVSHNVGNGDQTVSIQTNSGNGNSSFIAHRPGGSMHIGSNQQNGGESGFIDYYPVDGDGINYDIEFFQDRIAFNKPLEYFKISKGQGTAPTLANTKVSNDNKFGFRIYEDHSFYGTGTVQVEAQAEDGGQITLYGDEKTIVIGRNDQYLIDNENQQAVIVGKLVINNKGDEDQRAPDYVFTEEYQKKMPTLSELENYVLENKHMYNFPPGSEYETDYDIRKMNFKLIEKVEELYLYAIQQEKDLIEKTEKIEQISKRILRLRELVKD